MTDILTANSVTVNVFGDYVGGLLISQAQCEDCFETVNCTDSVHMEPLDREDHTFETTADRNNAIRNAQKIKNNILKLVRVFRKDEMLVKLTKEFKEIYTRQSSNEISAFLPQFEKMRQLWFIKLSTSVEDSERMRN